jgi:hypothetical protein
MSKPKSDAKKPPVEDAKDEFTVVIPRVSHRIATMLKGAKKDGVFKTVMVERWDAIGTANTAYSTLHSLQPKNCLDWTSMAGIFDVARVTSVSIETMYSVAGGTPNASATAIIAFDPGANAPITSVADGVSHAYISGVVHLASSQAAAQTGVPLAATPRGFLPIWTAKCSPNFESGFSSDLVGSNWFPVTASVNATIAYLAPYFEAAGAGVVVAGTSFVRYHMEFKYRH